MVDPNALYSYQGEQPQHLPDRIRLSDGTTRNDVSFYTQEEIESAGFTGPYSLPEYDEEYQRLLWDSENLTFVIEDISDEELWEKIRIERNRQLAESDWTMVGDVPGQINLPEWTKYRQRLRDIPSYYSSPKEVVFPIKPSDQESFDLPLVVEPRLRHRIEDLEASLKRLEYRIYKPFPSWAWNESEEKWEAPIAPPNDYDGQNYIWSEIYQEWRLLSEVQKSSDPTLEYNLE